MQTPLEAKPCGTALEATDPALLPAGRRQRTVPAIWKRVDLTKIGLFLASLPRFILASGLMKEGAGGLAPLIRGTLDISSPANRLGLRWPLARFLLREVPLLAATVGFLDNGLFDRVAIPTLIIGSRLAGSLASAGLDRQVEPTWLATLRHFQSGRRRGLARAWA